LPATVASDADAAQLLSSIANIGLANDIAVISALFDSAQQSTPTPMLLVLTSDALRGLADRITRLEAVHDVGCRFAGCKTNPTVADTPLAELIHALAMLPNASQMASVMSNASKLQIQQPALHAAFSKLAAQHDRLEQAWQTLDARPFSSLATISDPPAQAAGLAKLAGEAMLAWTSYSETGEFLPVHRPRLSQPMLLQSALVSALDSQRSELGNALTSYQSDRETSVNTILSTISNSQQRQAVFNRNTALSTQLGELFSRSLGLEAREAGARAQLAQFQQAFEAISPALDEHAVFQATTLAPLSATGNDAHHDLTAQTNLVGDQFHTEILTSGDALRLHVSDSWSPICALGNVYLDGPGFTQQKLVVPSPALTRRVKHRSADRASDGDRVRARAFADGDRYQLDLPAIAVGEQSTSLARADAR